MTAGSPRLAGTHLASGLIEVRVAGFGDCPSSAPTALGGGEPGLTGKADGGCCPWSGTLVSFPAVRGNWRRGA